jgi:molecular chaperone DnaK
MAQPSPVVWVFAASGAGASAGASGSQAKADDVVDAEIVDEDEKK